MLQGFYWDSFDATNWNVLKSQAEELGQYFSLVWLPQSANCGGTSMGYDDLYWFSNYNSSFGNENELRSLIQAFKDNGIGTIQMLLSIIERATMAGSVFHLRHTRASPTQCRRPTSVPMTMVARRKPKPTAWVCNLDSPTQEKGGMVCAISTIQARMYKSA